MPLPVPPGPEVIIAQDGSLELALQLPVAVTPTEPELAAGLKLAQLGESEESDSKAPMSAPSPPAALATPAWSKGRVKPR